MMELLKELQEKVAELEEKLNNLVKVGKIVAVNPKKATARVKFEDRDKTVSWELPIMHKHTKWDKTYWLPKVGELVYVLTPSLGNGLGIILGSSYNAEDTPPVEDLSKVRILFEDGTTIEYDKRSHKLYLNIESELEIVVPKAVFTTITTHNGNVTINGLLKVNGDIVASGDIADRGGQYGSVAILRDTYNSHTHPGDSGGTTGTPNQKVGG